MKKKNVIKQFKAINLPFYHLLFLVVVLIITVMVTIVIMTMVIICTKREYTLILIYFITVVISIY